MASPNLTTECTAFPKFPIKRRKAYSRELTLFEDDAPQTRLDATTKHEKPIKLVYANQSDSEKASFEAFFDARILAGTPFYWNDIRSAENDIHVHFLEAEFEPSVDGPRTWSWAVNLVRVP